jgi:cytochrome P450
MEVGIAAAETQVSDSLRPLPTCNSMMYFDDGRGFLGGRNMRFASELPLATMPVECQEFIADPQPWLEEARAQHPWLARSSHGYVVHGYQAVCDLFADNVHMQIGLGPIVEFYGMQGTMWARFMHEMLLVKEGEEHTRLRSSVAHAFTPRHANQVRPLMERTINRLLDEWQPKGAFNFPDFASLFPISVMCGLLGVSDEPIPQMNDALASQVDALAMDQVYKEPLLKGWEIMWTFADKLISEREASGICDEEHLLDAMVAVKRAGKLNDIELRFMVLVLLFAGYDTSKNQLAMIMHLLIERPEVYARCAEDKAYCGRVVQESLRHSGIAPPYRAVVAGFEYEGVGFRKGEFMIMATPFAGRDPSVFPDPLKFDPERENLNRHVSFGRGPHICLGQYIARTLLEEGLHQIARRMKKPRLTGDVKWRHFLGAWGPELMPIAFDPA